MHPIVWEVRAATEPRVLRPCPRCDTVRPFESSGRFRVNGNGRRLDVWLIYRCSSCDRTWNRTVHERVPPERLGADLTRYEQNDPALARAIAATPCGLPLEAAAFEVVGPAECEEIALSVDPGLAPRLDAVLAAGLGLSRSAVASRFAGLGKALRRPVRDGQRLSLAGSG